MFAKRILALSVLALVAAPAIAQTPTNRWDAEIAAFEAADRTNPPPQGAVLFLGSSSIRLWKTLAQDFPGHRVIHRGFGGSFISDSVHFAERIVFPYEPQMIVLYAGGNDLNAGKSVLQVFSDFKAFVEKVQAQLPRTRIAYISSAPNPARWTQVHRVSTLNDLIAGHTEQDPRLDFIDVFAHMLGEDGQPKPDIFVADRLHLNAKGYALWKDIVAAYLPGSTGLRVFPSPHRAPGQRLNSEVYNEQFRLNGKYELTEVKVFRVADLEANANAAPLWHLSPDANSKPTSTFLYGQPLPGLKSSFSQTPAAPLKAHERYRLVVRAGVLEGQADFQPVPVSPTEPK